MNVFVYVFILSSCPLSPLLSPTSNIQVTLALISLGLRFSPVN